MVATELVVTQSSTNVPQVRIWASADKSGAADREQVSPLSQEQQTELLCARLYPERNVQRGDEIEILKQVLSIPETQFLGVAKEHQLSVALVCREAANFLRDPENHKRMEVPAQLVEGALPSSTAYVVEESRPYQVVPTPFDSGYLERVAENLELRVKQLADSYRAELKEVILERIENSPFGEKHSKLLEVLKSRLELSPVEESDRLVTGAPRSEGHFLLSTLNSIATLLDENSTLPFDTRSEIIGCLVTGNHSRLRVSVSNLVRRAGFRAQIQAQVDQEPHPALPLGRDSIHLALRQLMNCAPTDEDKELHNQLVSLGPSIDPKLTDSDVRERVNSSLIPLPHTAEISAFLEPWLFSIRELDRDEMNGLMVLAYYGSNSHSHRHGEPFQLFEGTTGEKLDFRQGPLVAFEYFHDQTVELGREILKDDYLWQHDERRLEKVRREIGANEMMQLDTDELQSIRQPIASYREREEPHLGAALEAALRRLGFASAHVRIQQNLQAAFGVEWRLYIGPSVFHPQLN